MLLSFLTRIELFRGVTEAEAQKITVMCPEKRYPKGGTIFSPGDPPDFLYLLTKGLVKLVSISEKGLETILQIFKPDDVFGEFLLSADKRRFGAVAMEEAIVTGITREAFTELLASIPTVGLNFIKLLSGRLEKAERELAEFSHSWSYHRLAKILLELSESFGEEIPSGTMINLRMTHEDLANMIGTSRETVTTQLRRFEHMGLVARQGRRIILNKPGLLQFVQSEEQRIAPS
jgi:CRP-like cAMP-binding protein